MNGENSRAEHQNVHADSSERILAQVLEHRAYDPFVLSFVARARHERTTDAAELRQLGAIAAFAAVQMPGPQLFDARRSEMYREACALMSDAVFFEQMTAELGALDISRGTDVLRLVNGWDDVVGVHRDSGTAPATYRLLATVSVGAVDEGLSLGKALKAEGWGDAKFCVLLACVAARANELELASTCLEHAIRDLHFRHIEEVRAQPDLESLRVAKQTELFALTKLDIEVLGRFSSKVLPQFILIRNRSWFPLTNVVCTCEVPDGLGRVTSFKVSASYVPPRRGSEPSEIRIRSESLPRGWLRIGDERLRFRLACDQGAL